MVVREQSSLDVYSLEGEARLRLGTGMLALIYSWLTNELTPIEQSFWAPSLFVWLIYSVAAHCPSLCCLLYRSFMAGT